MKLFIVAVDEPIYLNPYLRALLERRPAEIVGVAVLRPRRRRRSLPRTVALALLSTLVFSPRNWRRLAALKLREALARILPIATRHRLQDICLELGVPVRIISTACDPALVRELKESRVDVVLNQTPEILRGEILQAPSLGVINRHMAWLPGYRGAWPVFWQFAHDERQLGITIHTVDAGIDTGPIIVREAVDRLPTDTIASAYERLFERSVALTCEALRRLGQGEPTIPNSGAAASYHGTPRIGDLVRFMLRRRIAPARRAA